MGRSTENKPLEKVPRFKYDVFICYRRKDGKAFANWLRQNLISYHLPPSFGKRAQVRLRVYQDTTYAKATEDFWQNSILPALSSSRYLAVVATPGALDPRADSEPSWMDREIATFASTPQKKNIFVVRGIGRPDDLLPGGLREKYPHIEQVDLTKVQPVWRRLRNRRRLRDALLTVAAALLDVRPDEMPVPRQEEKLRKRRQVWAVALTSILLFSVACLLSLKKSVAFGEMQWNYSKWMLSSDRRATASIHWTRPDGYDLWTVDSPFHDWTKVPTVSSSLEGFILSPKGNFVGTILPPEGSFQVLPFNNLEKAEITGAHSSPKTILHLVEHAEFPSIGFSQDERWIYALAADGSVWLTHPDRESAWWRVFRARSLEKSPYYYFPLPAFSTKGHWLLIRDTDLSIHLIRLKDPPVTEEPTPIEMGLTAAFDADEQRLAVVTNKALHVWNLAGDRATLEHDIEPLPEDATTVNWNRLSTAILFSPDGRQVTWRVVRGNYYSADLGEYNKFAVKRVSPAVPGVGTDALLCDVEYSGSLADDLTIVSFPGCPVQSIESNTFRTLQYSRDGRWVAGLAFGWVYLWSVGQNKNLVTGSPLSGDRLGFSPDSRYFVVHTHDDQLVVFRLGEEPLTSNTVAGHCGSDFLFAGNGNYLLSYGGVDLCWGPVGASLSRIGRTPTPIISLAESGDRLELFVFCESNLIVLKRTLTLWGFPLRTLPWPSLPDASPPIIAYR